MRRPIAIGAAALCGVLALGAGAVALDAMRVDAPPPLAASADAPAPPRTSPPVTAPSISADRAGEGEQTRGIEVDSPGPQSPPTSLSIPAIDVDTSLEQLGTLPDGSLATPVDTDLAGWFAGGPRPGAIGPAVIAGHVSWNGDPSVFFRLTELEPGDVLTVRQEDGTEVDFEVTRLEQHAKDEFPTVAVYSNTAGPELRLITCGGDFDSSTGHFDDNIVVFAERSEA